MSFINKALRAGVGVLLAAVLFKFFSSHSSFIKKPLDSYDFIIVGAGSTGSLLAARLSEHYSVLLVEAGGQFGWLSSIPLAAPFLQATENDWQFRTEPQQFSSFGLENKVSFWPRGKGLGGSGQMNYLVHYPGRKEDWEAFARAGVNGWSHLTMAHYMAKLRGKSYRHENVEVKIPVCAEDEVVHCSPRKCHVNQTRLFVQQILDQVPQRPVLYTSTTREVYTKKAAIVTNKEDPKESVLLHALNGAAQELRHLHLSVLPGESTVRWGKRWSSLQSHLLPAASNPRLHILQHNSAKRIIFNRSRVIGVQLGHEAVKAKREVIVSAGAIGTPHLLQLSGVGPASLLKDHGINVVADLPVGMNLHDHLSVPLYVSIEKPVSQTISKTLRLTEIFKYAIFGTGSFSGAAVVGTVSSGDSGVLMFGMGSTEEKLFRVISNLKSQVFSATFPDNKNHSAEGLVFLATCLRPRSRGWVQLKSSNPDEPPRIQPNYLQHPYDITCTRQAIRLVRRLLLTAPFQRLGSKMHLPFLQECSQYEPNINDDEYLECLIRTIGITGYHPAGTASMGNLTHSVVDSAFRVNKVSRLRVVDASVLPVPLLGAPHSVLLAMADRAANMIIAEANQI